MAWPALHPARDATGTILAVCLIAFAPPAAGQPYIPAAGEGTVTVTYQGAFARGLLGSKGQELSRPDFPRDSIDSHGLISYVEFGLSDRVAVHASLPAMMVRYEGPNPHTIGIEGRPSNRDDGAYHGSFQDVYVGSRFKLLESARFAVTPFVEVVIPTHHYESLAQAAVGRDLRALLVGAAVGGFADDLIPGLHFQARLSYAFTQKAVDIRPNRTAIDSAVGYFVTPRLAIQFIETFQLTHDGIEWVTPGVIRADGSCCRVLAVHNRDVWSTDYSRNHDRLARSNALSFGAGASFALTETVGVFGTVSKLVWGENLSAPRIVTVGMNWGFQTRRAASVRPDQNARVRVPPL